MGILKGKNVIIGITGGIAAYKVCDLINLLHKEKANVKAIMTEASEEFITPITIQTLTNNPVYKNMFSDLPEGSVEHIQLANWCDIFAIVPATANTIGKIACGISDNLLTTVVLALPEEIPVIIAPAMNTNMWKNPIFQQNIEKLRGISEKYVFVKPKIGRLACGDIGEGALAEMEDVLSAIKKGL